MTTTTTTSWTEATEQVRAFMREREWAAFHDPKNLAMALASEAGELVAELRWVPNSDADRACAEPGKRNAVAEELADVVILALVLADRIGVDLPEQVALKLRKNATRYPAEASRGKADPPG